MNDNDNDIFNDVTTRPWKASANKQEYLFEVKDLWLLLEEADWAITIKNKRARIILKHFKLKIR